MKETYSQARYRLLKALTERGWTVKPLLKTPQAVSPDGYATLYFRPQAVYLGPHSLFVDTRGMSVDDFETHVKAAVLLRDGVRKGA